jgi:nucleotide-binding universal stress UspA family protein
MAPRTLLLATDLSCRGDRALDRATELAAEWRARLVVLNVLQAPAPVTDLPSWRRPLDPHEAARRRVLRDLRGAEGLDLEVLVERGEPAPRILDVAGRLGCELIVTGVARDETLGRLLPGTTVEALVRRASVPVLVVKSRPRGAYRNVVVATDFSEGSRAALEAALALLPEARVRLFHAYHVHMESLVSDTTAARAAAALWDTETRSLRRRRARTRGAGLRDDLDGGPAPR